MNDNEIEKRYEEALTKAEQKAAEVLEAIEKGADVPFLPSVSINTDKAWKKVEHAAYGKRRTIRFTTVCLSAAAAVVALLLLFPVSEISTDEIYPVSGAVTLRLADGNIVNLKDNDCSQIISSVAKVDASSSKIDYSGAISDARSEKMEQIKLNELSVAKGALYHLILSDGTEVVLNSGSSIVYPEKFTGDTRNVKLTGEAYFNVTPDASHPFIVETSLYNVSVKGTSFDVCAYPNERYYNTTLVTGKVVVENGGEEIILSPCEQYKYDSEEMTAKVQTVDTSEILSWIDNELKFRKMKFEGVLQKLQQRYDFTFEISPSAENAMLTGTIPLDAPLSEILDILCSIHQLDWKIDDTKVIIK